MPKTFERFLTNNERWRSERLTEDPQYFTRLASGQEPPFLFVGCADSRVSPHAMMGVEPGEMFVVRNVANVVRSDDLAMQSVLTYALGVLRTPHVLVCGHYGCGGVQAVLDGGLEPPLSDWLSGVSRTKEAHQGELDAASDADARARRLVELHALAQAQAVIDSEPFADARAAWGGPSVHVAVFDLSTGAVRVLTEEV